MNSYLTQISCNGKLQTVWIAHLRTQEWQAAELLQPQTKLWYLHAVHAGWKSFLISQVLSYRVTLIICAVGARRVQTGLEKTPTCA